MSVDSHFFCMSIPPGEVVHPEFIRRAAGEVVSPLAGGARNDYGIVAFSRFFLCIIPNERDFGIGESFPVRLLSSLLPTKSIFPTLALYVTFKEAGRAVQSYA